MKLEGISTLSGTSVYSRFIYSVLPDSLSKKLSKGKRIYYTSMRRRGLGGKSYYYISDFLDKMIPYKGEVHCFSDYGLDIWVIFDEEFKYFIENYDN